MTWLAPIGFLGLIGIILLIIIYIIKPNYQQKIISSTFIWHMSLKFKKRRIPVSRLQSLLIFLCQVIILTTLGLLLAGPVITGEEKADYEENVIIIDASASMLLKEGGTSRFERAVNEAKGHVSTLLSKGGRVSIILADTDAEFIAQRASSDAHDEVTSALNALITENRCTYASADIEGAVALSEEVILQNEDTKLFLYTATEYVDKSGIEVVNVAHADDWNAAILDVRAEFNSDNHYEIYVDVGCYGKTEELAVTLEIIGANNKKEPVILEQKEFFDPSAESCTMVFNPIDLIGEHIYYYDTVNCHVDVADSFVDDNFFYLYGGKKPTIRIQYASTLPNSYFSGMMRTIRQQMKQTWNIEFVDIKANEKAALSGFDFYIFEHSLPPERPTDGLVHLVDPIGAAQNSGIIFGNRVAVDATSTLADGVDHPLTEYVDFSRVTIAKYTDVLVMEGYQELAYYNGQPVMLVKEDVNSKVVVWNFDLNYSNLPAMPDFSFLMYNMFNYFIPATLDSNSYEIGDVVELTARGESLTLSGVGLEMVFEDGHGEIVINSPGTYNVSQILPGKGEMEIVQFFVEISDYESNITKKVDALPMADVDVEEKIEYLDLILYFAIALVSVMFVEWWLYTRRNY